MKNKLIFIIVFIICITIPRQYVHASMIRRDISPNGINTYYVSTHEENFIVMSVILSRMETEAYIIYSGEMATSGFSYLDEAYKYHFMPQNQALKTSYSIGSYYSYSLVLSEINEETIKAHYNIYYLADIEQTKFVYDKIHKAIKDNITNLKTDYQKAYWAYHWVIDNFHYDETYNHVSAYDGFQSTGTVCSGYATLYSAIANELGLECSYVSGTVGQDDKINHAWNIIKLDCEWYCVDPTWGDSKYGDKFFLKSKEDFLSSDYGYHNSVLYDYYTDSGEVFASSDYTNANSTMSHGISPSVYNIEMDVLKINTLDIGESYSVLISNPDNVSISFISTNPKIAKVDKNGVVTGLSKGTTNIIAYNANLNIVQCCKITVVSN